MPNASDAASIDELPSPEFLAAAMEYQIYADAPLTHLSAARAAMARMIKHAPPSIQHRLHEKAIAMGLIPKPSHYLPDGTPVYALESLAVHFGMSVDEVKSTLNPTAADVSGINTIHTIQ